MKLLKTSTDATGPPKKCSQRCLVPRIRIVSQYAVASAGSLLTSSEGSGIVTGGTRSGFFLEELSDLGHDSFHRSRSDSLRAAALICITATTIKRAPAVNLRVLIRTPPLTTFRSVIRDVLALWG